MKATIYVAMSLNGMVADKKGSEDFLSDVHWKEFCRLGNAAGCVLFGRKTYEMLKKWDKKYLNQLKAKIIVISHKDSKDKDVLYAKNPKIAINMAKKQGFKEVVSGGGPILNTSIMTEGLADKAILSVEPVRIEGKYLFNDKKLMKRLWLTKMVKVNSKIIQFHYKVK